ncbi:aminoglycoside phosphotransferase family protein [Tritonibacter multivorans]|nr:aminoglycoside phosphotransferase family protein [Tritonibacter multivorans]MDA7420172.1 aminoglycoside phosphotransferase family protein [Tritonibacter multivorans]
MFRHVAGQGFVLETPLRLSGGRSNHVWRAGRFILKLFASSARNPLFANSAASEQSVLETLSGTGLVPDLCAAGQFEGQNWLLYRHIEGTPWRENTAQVAALLGKLHQLNPPSGLPLGANGSADLAAQTLDILRACDPVEDTLLHAPEGVVTPTDHMCLIHGDPVPGNIVVRQGGLVLIDWQCPKVGDPAEDLALFLSPAMQTIYGRDPLSDNEVQTFLTAYPDPEVVARLMDLRPWFHWRMASYCLWRGDRAAANLELAALGLCRS